MTALDPLVADTVGARWPDRAAAWIDAIPHELAEVCTELSVTPTGRTFAARAAHVVEASTQSGVRLVLRSSPDPHAADQAAALQRLAHAGLAPAVHLLRHTATSIWTAMDAVSPGTSFADQEPTPSELTAVTPMLGTLASLDAPPTAPSILTWLRARLTEPPAEDQPPHRDPAPASARSAALVLLDELADGDRAGMCHGDLSPPNVLHGESRLWFIDPRGMSGDTAYDVAVLALKLSDDDLDTAHALARSIALASGHDPERAAAWVTVADAATV